MTPKIYSFSLQEIADWTLKKGNKWDKPHAEIPKFQRGLVWNPAQIEVLWDSLLRGIPIGVFSFISAKNSPSYGNIAEGDDEVFWLLDGQQRANAISLGYQKDLEGQTSATTRMTTNRPGRHLFSVTIKEIYVNTTTKGQDHGMGNGKFERTLDDHEWRK